MCSREDVPSLSESYVRCIKARTATRHIRTPRVRRCWCYTELICKRLHAQPPFMGQRLRWTLRSMPSGGGHTVGIVRIDSINDIPMVEMRNACVTWKSPSRGNIPVNQRNRPTLGLLTWKVHEVFHVKVVIRYTQYASIRQIMQVKRFVMLTHSNRSGGFKPPSCYHVKSLIAS